MGRVGVDETAFPHRLAHYSLVILGIWTDPAEQATHVRWVRELWEAMQPYSSEAVYVNYLDADDADRVGQPTAGSPIGVFSFSSRNTIRRISSA